MNIQFILESKDVTIETYLVGNGRNIDSWNGKYIQHSKITKIKWDNFFFLNLNY